MYYKISIDYVSDEDVILEIPERYNDIVVCTKREYITNNAYSSIGIHNSWFTYARAVWDTIVDHFLNAENSSDFYDFNDSGSWKVQELAELCGISARRAKDIYRIISDYISEYNLIEYRSRMYSKHIFSRERGVQTFVAMLNLLYPASNYVSEEIRSIRFNSNIGDSAYIIYDSNKYSEESIDIKFISCAFFMDLLNISCINSAYEPVGECEETIIPALIDYTTIKYMTPEGILMLARDLLNIDDDVLNVDNTCIVLGNSCFSGSDILQYYFS